MLNYPRLAAARRLLAPGAVRAGPGGHEVQGTHGLYRVLPEGGRLRCTCLFEARHQGSRGPCTHALAVQLLG